MSIIKEFKDFAVKGNVADMAVGLVVGVAFGKIITSLVADVITPPLGVLMGGVDFSNLAITLKAATAEAPAVVLSYGKFLQTTFDFIIVALALFVFVKALNAMKRKQEDSAAAIAVPPTELLLTEIRDLLKK